MKTSVLDAIYKCSLELRIRIIMSLKVTCQSNAEEIVPKSVE